MINYIGRVNGIDAQLDEKMQTVCYAFINMDRDNYLQVTTKSNSLQSALELACLKDVEVEVTFDETGNTNQLTRVRILDR